MWEEDFYYGFEPKEEMDSPEDRFECECDYCGEKIRREDSAIGIVAPDGSKLMLHKGEEIDVTDLLELLGVFYVEGEADEVSDIIQNHVVLH